MSDTERTAEHVSREEYEQLRKEHLNAMIELEWLKGEAERLTSFRDKYLERVREDAIKEYGLEGEHAEQWRERLTGTTEDEIYAQARELQIQLRLNKPKYVDPVWINPPVYKPSSGRDSLYELGRETAKKALGVKPAVRERDGMGSIRSSIHVPAPKRKTPKRSEYKGGGGKLYEYGRKIYSRIFGGR